MPVQALPASYRIGDWHFRPASHELAQDGRRVRLPRRQSLLLERLARQPGQTIERQTLIDEVWQRRMVEDDVLSRSIADLRRALGDDSRQPRYIETVPKSGYRMCAAVRRIESEAVTPDSETQIPGAGQPPRDASPRTIPRVAVIVAVLLLATTLIYATLPSVPRLTSADFVRERPLTSQAGWETVPALSADGNLLAYSEQWPDRAHSALVLQTLRGEGKHAIDDSDDWNESASFSPDGRRIAYLHVQAGQCELRLRPVLGGAARSLASCAASPLSAPAWSTDGQRMVYTAPAANGTQAPALWLLENDAGRTWQLTHPKISGGPDADPRWTPDGRAISFARGLDGEQDLLTVAIDPPHGEHLLFGGGNRLQGHVWISPQQILLASDSPGFRALVSVDPSTGVASLLGGRGARYPARADNGTLVYEMASFDANIWMLDLDRPAAEPTSVVASTRYDAGPVLSPDATRLAFTSTRNDFEQVWIGPSDGGGNEQALALPAGKRWTRPSWSPDGTALLLACYEADGETYIYRYRFDGARLERLDALGAMAGAAQYSADGRQIVFLRRDHRDGTSIWIAEESPAGATAHPAGRPHMIEGTAGADQFRVADDLLVYSRVGERGLKVRALQPDSAPNTVLSDAEMPSRFAWTLAGRRIFYVARSERQWTLFALDLGTGSSQLLAREVKADAVGPALAVSPDGRRIWFARTDRVTVDLMEVPPPP